MFLLLMSLLLQFQFAPIELYILTDITLVADGLDTYTIPNVMDEGLQMCETIMYSVADNIAVVRCEATVEQLAALPAASGFVFVMDDGTTSTADEQFDGVAFSQYLTGVDFGVIVPTLTGTNQQAYNQLLAWLVENT